MKICDVGRKMNEKFTKEYIECISKKTIRSCWILEFFQRIIFHTFVVAFLDIVLDAHFNTTTDNRQTPVIKKRYS